METYIKCYAEPKNDDMWLNNNLLKNSGSSFIIEGLGSHKRLKNYGEFSLKLEIKQKSDEDCLWLTERDLDIKLKSIYKSISDAKIYFSQYQDHDDEAIFFDKTTFKRASKYLVIYAKRILYKFNIVIDAPDILPGPDNTIDILWSNPNYELLLNIPPENNSIATFYGDNRKGEHIKGTINIDLNKINNGLILFLCNSI